jgi:hypothetical protein
LGEGLLVQLAAAGGAQAQRLGAGFDGFDQLLEHPLD